MNRPESRIARYGSPDFDISRVLGPLTCRVLETAVSGDTFLIKERRSGNLSSAKILASGLPLTNDQLQLIRDAANEPCAYYNGRPIFKRLPPGQNFAIQLHAESGVLDLMLDLQNSSWGFYCGSERYQEWNWVGHHFVDIAQASFPEIASKTKGSVWQRGAIAKLEAGLEQ